MTKRRTPQQRVGRNGEDAFQLFAGRHYLLPSRPYEDFGFDFLCQVEAMDGGSTREITGDFVGVAVRATSARANRVRLTRSDAESLLRAKFVVCLVLVEVKPTSTTAFHRFLDEDFAADLIDLVSSDRLAMTITPRHCANEADFDSNLAAALNGNFPERVRVAVARRRLSRHLPDPLLEIQRSAEGELTLVAVEDFYDYFVRDDVPTRDDAYAAIFGSPRLRMERLAAVGPRPELMGELARLPEPILMGAVGEVYFSAIVENAGGRSATPFTRVSTPTHGGWVQEGGFSITISKRMLDGDRWVHELHALIDADEDLDLTEHPALWAFLERCTSDAILSPEDQPRMRLNARQITGLSDANFFARTLRRAVSLGGWADVIAPLRLATDQEALHTMAFMAEAAERPDFLQGFGFKLASGDSDVFGEVRVTCQVPVIGNLGTQAIVCWFDADVTLFTKGDTARGVRFDDIASASVEVGQRVEKRSDLPELVVDGTWPTVAIGRCNGERSESDATDWNVGLRSIELKGS